MVKKIAIIGSTGGIGSALLDHFCSLGFECISFSRSSSNHSCFHVRCDLTSASDVSKIIEIIRSDCAEAYYCAGIADFELEPASVDQMTGHILPVNALAPVAIIDALIASQWPGRLYVMGSFTSSVGTSRSRYYSASKSFLDRYIESVLVDVRASRMTLVYLILGYVNTPKSVEMRNLPLPGLSVAGFLRLVARLRVAQGSFVCSAPIYVPAAYMLFGLFRIVAMIVSWFRIYFLCRGRTS